MEPEHEIQRHILLKLIHNPELSFTELWDGKSETNKFAYHVGVLETKGLVIKREGLYSLSDQGRALSAFIEGDTGTKAAFPTFAHALIVREGDRILVQKRLKEPFYGYWGLISGKINFGYNIEECAKRDLVEETGLLADKAEFIGVNQIKTYESEKLAFHHIMFFVRLSGLSGMLKERTHKGENAWMTIDEFKEKDRFPDAWLDAILGAKQFLMIETQRFMKDGKFKSGEIISKKSIG